MRGGAALHARLDAGKRPAAAQVHGHRGADGPRPAAHLHQRQHQGAPGLQLRALRPRWRAGRQRAAPARAPGRHVRSHPVPGGRLPQAPARPCACQCARPRSALRTAADCADCGLACRRTSGARRARARPRACARATCWRPTTRSWRAGRTCPTSPSSRLCSTRAASSAPRPPRRRASATSPPAAERVPRRRFFVASRGHHADVGGITPGSMPPNSRRLVEEGAAIIAFKLVRAGRFQVGPCRRCHVRASGLHAPAAQDSATATPGVDPMGVKPRQHGVFDSDCCLLLADRRHYGAAPGARQTG